MGDVCDDRIGGRFEVFAARADVAVDADQDVVPLLEEFRRIDRLGEQLGFRRQIEIGDHVVHQCRTFDACDISGEVGEDRER